jgi:energy-coupling factor transporter ATP-binding protein EcfA2
MSTPLTLAYTLSDVTLEGGLSSVLGPTSHTLRDHAVTVLLGPSGCGKSQLLRALSGRRPQEPWRIGGHWTWRDQPLRHDQEPPAGMSWLDQRPRCTLLSHDVGHWREAFEGNPHTILLDEPDRGVTELDRAELVVALRQHTARGCAVVVTHDLTFARAIGDDILLLCDGQLRSRERALSFFDRPRTPLSVRFLQQGNCWSDGPPPALPSHFRWVIPGRLAGMAQPGLLGDESEDLAAMTEAGVTELVTLTERPLAGSRIGAFPIVSRHFPIRDMGVPGLDATTRLCASNTAALDAGGVVVLHCRAGLGRTGTMLGAQLLWLRRSTASTVLDDLRRVNRGYVQSQAQLDFLRMFAEYSGA